MKIETDVLRILATSTVTGNRLALPHQLERALYLRTDKVLKALGGKWDRRAGAHVFEQDAGDLVEAVVLTGQVTLPADFGFFRTPPHIVGELMNAAAITPRHRVLEPSAGDGAIAIFLREIAAVVRCVEMVPDRIAQLERLGLTVWAGDFLEMAPDPTFDRVVMNPPFAKRQDVRHVIHASKWLLPGGRLAAVMSAGVTFRDDRLGRNFRSLIDACDGEIRELAPQSFRGSGTDVNTVLVTMQAPEEGCLELFGFAGTARALAFG